MLVLSRKVSERIQIGPDIAITIVRIHGDSVRIGIDAPKSINVDREEILISKQASALQEVTA